jgi:hypothetical protein
MNTENTSPELASVTEESIPDTIDLAWIFGRLVSIMYFIEYQHGAEAGAVIEQIGRDVEYKIRNGVGDEE